MSENPSEKAMPPVPIALEVGSRLVRIADQDDVLYRRVHEEITTQAASILDTLGVPGKAVVEISEFESYDDDDFLHVRVNGELCRYSLELVHRAACYASGIPLAPAADLTHLMDLVVPRRGQPEDDERLIEFTSLVCIYAILAQPSVLLGAAQVSAYSAALKAAGAALDMGVETPPDENRAEKADALHPVLAEVLDLGISIADRQTVQHIVVDLLTGERAPDVVVERLVSELSPREMGVEISQSYLRRLTTSAHERTNFTLMYDGLFTELGVVYPDWHFESVEDLKPTGFAFRLNHLRTLPSIGLQPEQCLANNTPGQLALLGIKGIPALNPASLAEGAIIASADRVAAEQAGLTTWDGMSYLILCFARDLREHSHALVHVESVQAALKQLEVAFPAVIKAARDRSTDEKITRVLRALLAEGIAVRNLRQILQLIAGFDYVSFDTRKVILLDERLPILNAGRNGQFTPTTQDLTSFVRKGMRRYISHKYSRGLNSLSAYLLDPQIEELLGGEPGLPATRAEAVFRAIQFELEGNAVSVEPAPVLTAAQVRPTLRALTRIPFPRLAILAYEELAPELNISPLTRIELDALDA